MSGYFLKNRRCIVATLLLCLSFISSAQEPVKLYDEMCDPLQAVFCDYVSREASVNTIDDAAGKYIGSVIDDALYGWGVFYSSSGVKSYGQYANNQLIFGIVMSDKVAKVGSQENYILYELETGEALLLHSTEGNIPLKYPLVPDMKHPEPLYTFKKETYANGDYFFGEFYKGRRHGYGVYCYSNGDIWYGQYQGGYRNGYGMLLKANEKIYYGKWVGDRKVK